jgi:hypothetical protein
MSRTERAVRLADLFGQAVLVGKLEITQREVARWRATMSRGQVLPTRPTYHPDH